jgi:hypothetical protein
MEASELPRWFLDNRQQNLKLEWGAMIGTMSESPPPYSQDELTSKLTLTEMLPLIALSGSLTSLDGLEAGITGFEPVISGSTNRRYGPD